MNNRAREFIGNFCYDIDDGLLTNIPQKTGNSQKFPGGDKVKFPVKSKLLPKGIRNVCSMISWRSTYTAAANGEGCRLKTIYLWNEPSQSSNINNDTTTTTRSREEES